MGCQSLHSFSADKTAAKTALCRLSILSPLLFLSLGILSYALQILHLAILLIKARRDALYVEVFDRLDFKIGRYK